MGKSIYLGRQRDVDMTEGGITGLLLRFAIPLLVGNLFQQLYNTVDAWVVGNFVSNEAFAAVGTVGPIINTVVGFFMGLSSGTGVVVSQHFGAGRTNEVRNTVHTVITATLLLGVLMTGLGIALVPALLKLTATPTDVFPESKAYLVIYFAGILGLMIYNIGSGILRAVGDSTRPFYFLVMSAVVNTVLDLLFVLRFHMGVRGVAYATVIAQVISAILVLITLSRSESCIRFDIARLGIDRAQLGEVLKVGIPIGLQTSIVSFSNMFVQSYINHFETDCMAAWTVYNKIDQFATLPMQSLMVAITTFAGQNKGAGRPDRIRSCIRKGLIIITFTSVLLLLPLILFAPQLVAFFNRKAEVIAYGSLLLRVVAPMLIGWGVSCVFSGTMNGCGNTRISMILSIGSYVAFRQVYLFIMARFVCNEFLPIAFGYPAGWIVCSVGHVIYYFARGKRYIEQTAQ